MASTLLDTDKDEGHEGRQLGGQMSFLDHLDELRRRLIRSIIFIFAALLVCWFVSDRIYNFLSVPVRRAMAEAAERPVPLKGLTGGETIMPLGSLSEGSTGRYVFAESARLGQSLIPAGASVAGAGARRPRRQAGGLPDQPA